MGSVEVPRWLKRLPLAPEFRPSDTEFADPIAYISKIEKEASAFGICKIIPPLPKPSKGYVFHNLNDTLSKCPELGKGVGVSSVEEGEPRAVFTTRQQELGQGARRMKGVDGENQPLGGKKHVWQSGEVYTLEQFESKSKVFLRSVLGMIKEVNPLVIEALFWKAASEKPIYVEYANDVPGSGFAEPEGQFQYFRRWRRKRASYQSYRENRGNSDSTKMEMESKHVSQDQHVKDGDHDVNPCPERSSSNASISSPDGITRSAKQRCTVSGNDMVGTAGWKLSNSPWNLQVIARSPGSLTRFMPADIPGVTSPMVYIGMLFSWFAWHVEDHELHSLNFLHTGSPKTWYAVPGEHAQTFEETIRTEVYGGDVDRLAALTLLGEKTTLLSPEAIASSGIPCCRLVQNPGEFVVTFPRAYHVGFSHGFNCGEAANFGTPQWLEVAKDAAVRRAAMNYLPMLSHQQLMYLLTMSFVARVPRSLLPGVRSSRLRDRQREDRELSVKKAFLEDVLKENQILSCLLAKNSAYYAVTWNADLLPCAKRETQLPGMAAAKVNLPTQDASHLRSDCSTDGEKRDLVQEMSLYMENLNGLYVEDDDDLSTDFQMDSGSLACVACGILGFPFMCVIQPSKLRSLKHLSFAQRPVKEDPGTTNSHAHSEDDCVRLPHLSVPHMNFSTPQGWSTSCRFLRPHIFCLEHGTQIEQLLRSKGGANLLVICYSDYQKIKAHVSAIAEEISVPCDYHDGSMDIASQEELNLIYLAIDDNVRTECGEDWTSVLGINLRYCVKIRKCSPSQNVQHALALGGLFSEDNARPHSCMKWQSKRSRSRVKLEQFTLIQSSEEYDAKREKVLPKESTLVCVKQEKKLIQYSRRKFKEKVSNVNMSSEACQGKQSMENLPEMYASCSGGTKIKRKPQGANASKIETLATASIDIISSVKEANDAPAVEEIMNSGNTEANHISRVQNPMNVVGRNDENDPIPSTHSNLSFNETGERFTMHRESQVIEGKFTFTDDYHTIVSVKWSGVQAEDGDDTLNRILGIAEPRSSHYCTSPSKQVDDLLSDELCRNNVLHQDILDAKVGRRLQTMQGSDSVQCASCTKISSDELAGSMAHQPAPVCGETSSGIQMESSAATVLSGGRTSENNMMLEVGGKDQSVSCSYMELENNDSKEVCAVSRATSSGGDLCSTLTLDGEAQEETQTRFKRTTELHFHDSAISMQCQSLPVSVIDHSDAQRENLADNCLSYGGTDAEMHPRSDSAHGLVGHEVPPTAVPTNDLVSSMSVPIRSLVAEEDSYAVDLSIEGKEDCFSNQQNLDPKLSVLKKRKRKREVEKMSKDSLDDSSFIRSPCEGLRPRAARSTRSGELHVEEAAPETTPVRSNSKSYNLPAPRPIRHELNNKSYKCDLEGCRMCFHTKTELSLHKRNQCPYEGCKKRFSSHKYAMVHQRVHEDDRPLKCPWKGCSMTFKWAWARKEHMRVHTGEKPYQCRVEGCGLAFRFVSDFSRHRRRTGHHLEAPASP